MVYDAATKNVVLYGGYANALPAIDTWEWEPLGGTWKQHSAKPPSVFLMAAVTYDSTRARTFLFGGYRHPNDGLTNEIWEWDGTAASWSSPTVAGKISPPPPQGGAVAAYDPLRRRVVVHAIGAAMMLPPPVSQAWDPQTRSWGPPTVGGPQVGDSAFVWDVCRDRGVFFGGWDTDELWEWDPSTSTWTERLPLTGESWPPPRVGASLVFDTSVGRVLLLGGRRLSAETYFDDLWQWDGPTGTWTNLSLTTGARPPARARAGAVYDSARQRLVIFGGIQASGDGLDLWEWQRFQ